MRQVVGETAYSVKAAIGFPMLVAYWIAMIGEDRCPECGYRMRRVCTMCGAGR